MENFDKEISNTSSPIDKIDETKSSETKVKGGFSFSDTFEFSPKKKGWGIFFLLLNTGFLLGTFIVSEFNPFYWIDLFTIELLFGNLGSIFIYIIIYLFILKKLFGVKFYKPSWFKLNLLSLIFVILTISAFAISIDILVNDSATGYEGIDLLTDYFIINEFWDVRVLGLIDGQDVPVFDLSFYGVIPIIFWLYLFIGTIDPSLPMIITSVMLVLSFGYIIFGSWKTLFSTTYYKSIEAAKVVQQKSKVLFEQTKNQSTSEVEQKQTNSNLGTDQIDIFNEQGSFDDDALNINYGMSLNNMMNRTTKNTPGRGVLDDSILNDEFKREIMTTYKSTGNSLHEKEMNDIAKGNFDKSKYEKYGKEYVDNNDDDEINKLFSNNSNYDLKNNPSLDVDLDNDNWETKPVTPTKFTQSMVLKSKNNSFNKDVSRQDDENFDTHLNKIKKKESIEDIKTDEIFNFTGTNSETKKLKFYIPDSKDKNNDSSDLIQNIKDENLTNKEFEYLYKKAQLTPYMYKKYMDIKTREMNKAKELEKINQVNKTNQFDKTSEINNTSEFNSTGEFDETNIFNETKDINKTHNINKTNKIKNVDKTNEFTDENEFTKTSSLNKTNQINSTSEMSTTINLTNEISKTSDYKEYHKKLDIAETSKINSSNLENLNEKSKRKKSKCKNYKIPSISQLENVDHSNQKEKAMEMKIEAEQKKVILNSLLESFGVDAEVMNYIIGPRLINFELKIGYAVKITKIKNLEDNIKLALEAKSIRIQAPIPGRNFVGIEIPHSQNELIGIKEVITDSEILKNDDDEKSISIALGKNSEGKNIVFDLKKAPHLLIAGATGSGKSVAINIIIVSILLNFSPNELKLLLIDPKMVEFTSYRDIPHLIAPIITDSKKSMSALKLIVDEMEKRYAMMSELGVKNLDEYNSHPKIINSKKEPYIVIVIDELADLMLVTKKEVEESIMRITQKARSAGIYAIIATQKPSTEVVTGVIKANIPSRISFSVSSGYDSKTIIDQTGAERLLGRGDMLISLYGKQIVRGQSSFISNDEINNIVFSIKSQCESDYWDEFSYENLEKNNNSMIDDIDNENDSEYLLAKKIILESRKASVSYLQRRMKIGYNKAADLIEKLEYHGVIGPSMGSKNREIYD